MDKRHHGPGPSVRRKQRGLTLIEVMIAAAMLMTALTAVFAMYSWCAVEIRRARQRSLAARCAQRMMEMLISTPRSVLMYDGFGTVTPPSEDNPVAEDVRRWQACVQALPRPATGQITARDDPDTPYATMIQVSIRYDNYGRAATFALSRTLPARSP